MPRKWSQLHRADLYPVTCQEARDVADKSDTVSRCGARKRRRAYPPWPWHGHGSPLWPSMGYASLPVHRQPATSMLAAPDRSVVADPQLRRAFLQMLREALR
jgi:hypothetical protein